MRELAAGVATIMYKKKEKSQPKTLNPESRELFPTDQIILQSNFFFQRNK